MWRHLLKKLGISAAWAAVRAAFGITFRGVSEHFGWGKVIVALALGGIGAAASGLSNVPWLLAIPVGIIIALIALFVLTKVAVELRKAKTAAAREERLGVRQQHRLGIALTDNSGADKRVTIQEVVRRAALETDWAYNHQAKTYEWSSALQRQIIDPFSSGKIIAEGLYSEAGKPEARGVSTIPISFWAKAWFSPEFALSDCSQMSVYSGGKPPEARADEITILAADMDRFWPKAEANGREASIERVFLEWKSEHERSLPEGLDWQTYSENQYRYERQLLYRLERPKGE